ncbi:MAG: 4-hydroxyphenylacetate 3-hydroxylase family protein [Dehalococcoidia bacterium]|nr:4-hydroxyphenylacetate 3-hydroxylase family protein [Dehalococcoidia bacterium]
MRTSSDYLAKLKSMKPNVYLGGKKIEKIWEEPRIIPGINTISLTYDLANDPQYDGLTTATSHLTGEKINRFVHIHQSTDDLMKKVDMTRMFCRITGGCIQRCMGIDGLNAVSVVTHEMDQKLGTNYHPRFLEYLKFVQENDMTLAGSMTDVKGDRNLRPHEQADPDMYVHVVERRADGIVIKGAKAHNTIAPYSEELLVMPTRALTEADADYAVCCAVPTDAPGVTLICTTAAPAGGRKLERPASSKYCFVDSLTIFDNVFVPWERVFMCGEWQAAGLVANYFATYHRHSYCGCKPATTDLLIGMAAQIADYNGVEKASHVRDKITDMIMTGEMVYACGIAGSLKGQRRSSGTYYPDAVFVNSGKYHAGTNLHHEYETVQDIAGGLCATMPSEESYFSPEIGPYMEKYLKGRADVTTEDRIRCFMLIEDYTVSRFGGVWAVAGIHGGGSPQAEKVAIIANYDVEARKKMARKLANIAEKDTRKTKA